MQFVQQGLLRHQLSVHDELINVIHGAIVYDVTLHVT
jgi:hypothetical protein